MKEVMKVYLVDELIEGTSSNGNPWEKQMVVFEAIGGANRKLAVSFMNERKTRVTKKLQVGQYCEVTYDISSREYEGKWFTQVDGIAIVPLSPAVQPDAEPEATEEEAAKGKGRKKESNEQ